MRLSRLPILTLHSIDDSGSVISLAPRALEALLRSLAEAGYTGLSVSGALQRMRDGNGTRCVAITFDDAYANVLRMALPRLRDLGFTATVFAIAGRCGLDNRWAGQPQWVPELPLLDWGQLQQLLAAGWEVGSHGMSHRRLTVLPAPEAEREIVEARHAIVANLGIEAECFAYPYGAHDAAVRQVVGRYHRLAFGTRLAVATAAEIERRLAISRVDAYYLRGRPAARVLDAHMGAAYLTLRRWGRGVRRRISAAVG